MGFWGAVRMEKPGAATLYCDPARFSPVVDQAGHLSIADFRTIPKISFD